MTSPVVPPVLTPPAAKLSSEGLWLRVVAFSSVLLVLFVAFMLSNIRGAHDKEMAELRGSVTAKETELAARDAEVAAKEAKLAAIEEAKKGNVEVIDVEEDGTIHIKRHQTIGPLPVQSFGICEEGEIPLITPKPQAVETPQARAPAKPEVNWPSETIDGTTMEKFPPPAVIKKPQPVVQKRWKFLGRDQFGCEYWEEVPVARPTQATPASRDIRYRRNNF
ncbi:MAG: hypothetical protein AAB847_00115 [Patescibacteria group bacterium]